MNRIIFSLLVLLFIYSCSDDRLLNNQVEKGSIKGIVYDFENDTTISNAYIYTEPPSSSVKSDDNGNFEIKNIAVGDYKVFAEKHQYQTSENQFSVLPDNEQQLSLFLKGIGFENKPPSIPALVFPKFNSKVSDNNIIFTWENSMDPDNDLIYYSFYFGEEVDNLDLVRDSIANSKYKLLRDLDTNVTYFWKVSVTDGYYTKVSETYKFEFTNKSSGGNDSGSPGISEESLILNVPLDGNSLDVSGNFSPIATQNVQYVPDRYGISSSAAYFNGRPSSHSKIVFPNDPKFDLGTSFTIACWARQDQSAGENGSVGYYEIVSRWGGGGDNLAAYAIGINFQNQFFLSTYNGSSGDSYFADVEINREEWHHLCLVFDNGTAKFYVDGELTNTESDIITPQQSKLNLSIGARPDQLSSFHGAVDQVYIFKRVISETEIEILADF